MKKKLLEISDFANLMGLTRQTLIYYDKIDLFKPYIILDNKYRMYSYSQMGTVTLIYILSELGIPLKEIKEIIKDINPTKALDVLDFQQNKINEKINQLELMKDLINIRIDQIKEGLDNNNKLLNVFIEHISNDRYIYIGDILDKNNLNNDDFIKFYKKLDELNIPAVGSQGVLIKKENVINKKIDYVTNIFVTLNNKKLANKKVPKGDYLVCYVNGDYGKTDFAYDYIYKYIENNNLEIIGDSYEEYLIDELSTNNSNNFILKISVNVKYKEN